MEKIDFNLLNIVLLECVLPAADIGAHNVPTDFMWKYSFDFHISSMPNNDKAVPINISFKLYSKNDPDEKTIASIEILSYFTLSGNLTKIEHKLSVIHKLLSISLWNLQGAFAAKTEGSSLQKEIPPGVSFETYYETLKNKVSNEWK